MTTDDRFLIIIAGPTAVGKTKTSIEITRLFATEIISADSRQFYKEMNIGTARPTTKELSAVPHHFIGHLSVSEEYNVARYETDVLSLLEKLFFNKHHVVMTGVSGLYINAVCHGIDDLPDPEDSIRTGLKELYANKGLKALQEKLQEVDPVYYSTVDQANPKRLIRAIEVYLSTGIPFSSLRKNQPKPRPFRIIRIGLVLPRKELYERINTRTDAMMKNGLLKEAEELFPLRQLNALNTVGYKELFDYFEGKCSLDEAVTKIKVHTRRYAKRQLTWFRKDSDYTWFHPDDIDGIIKFISRQK